MKRLMTALALLFVMVTTTETRMLADEPKGTPTGTKVPPVQPKAATPQPNLAPMEHTFYVDEIAKDGIVTGVTYGPDGEHPFVYVSMDWKNNGLRKGHVFQLMVRPAMKPDGTAKMADDTAAPVPNVFPMGHMLYVSDIAKDGQLLCGSYEPDGTMPPVFVALDWEDSGLVKNQVFQIILQPVRKSDGSVKVVDVQEERDHNNEVARQMEVDEIKGITEGILGKPLTLQQKIMADNFFGSALKVFDEKFERNKPEDEKTDDKK